MHTQMHTHCSRIFKAMSCRSVPSRPTHLHSSKALAPSASAIGLSDQDRPPIGKFMTG